MVSQIYPLELHRSKANISDTCTEAAILDLHLSIVNDFVSSKNYDKHDKYDDFDFEIVHFPFLDGMVPRSKSCGVYISQLIRLAGASSHVADFTTINKLLTQKPLKQGYTAPASLLIQMSIKTHRYLVCMKDP